jgi:hypothetical protein
MTPTSWYERAKRSGESALDIYDRDSVEYELALHLLRALRELESIGWPNLPEMSVPERKTGQLPPRTEKEGCSCRTPDNGRCEQTTVNGYPVALTATVPRLALRHV